MKKAFSSRRRWHGVSRDGCGVAAVRFCQNAEVYGLCTAHLISQKSEIFDSFSSRRSLGTQKERRMYEKVVIGTIFAHVGKGKRPA